MTILTSNVSLKIAEAFEPSRLILARRRRGLSQIGLARAVEIDRRSVVGFEAGEFTPSSDTLLRLAEELKFPVGFFMLDPIELPSPDAVSFRAYSKLPATLRDKALSQGAIAVSVSEWLDRRFVLPTVDLPDLSSIGDPEMAANALRAHWGRGKTPILNMIHLLEGKGIRVFSLSIDSREVDAFSMWNSELPFVFLNNQKSAERSRFDAAHELGHLVMHRHAKPEDSKAAEREANQFASAFLMPHDAMLGMAPRVPSRSSLMRLKHHWRVSLAAVVYRLKEIAAISDWQSRSLFGELSAEGWLTSEPEGIPRETSRILEKVYDQMRRDGSSKSEILSDLQLGSAELDSLTLGAVFSTIRGGVAEVGDSERPTRPATNLKRIK